MDILHTYLPNFVQFGILGYWFVLAVAFLESLAFVGIFFPGTLLVVLAGALAAQGSYDFWDLFIFATIGAILGDAVSYELGRRGKEYVGKRTQLERGRAFFERYGALSIFIGRFIGPLRPVITVVAGSMGMDRWKFYIANVASALIWSVSLLALGYVFGAAWKVALASFTKIGLILLIPLLLFFLLLWLWRWTLRHGRTVFAVLSSILRSSWSGLIHDPYVKAWLERHPAFIAFLQRRVSLENFQGLPLTLLVGAMLYTIVLFTEIVQDYIVSDPLIALDVRLANLFAILRTPQLIHFFYSVTLLGSEMIVILIALAVTGLLWYERKRLSILVLWLSVLGSSVLTTLGKLLFHRPRPSEIIAVLTEKSYSFPSGHATAAVALYGFLAYLVIREHSSWRVKVSAFFGALVLIFLIDLSRLYLGVHYVSDVLAGNTLAFGVLLFAISVGEWLRSRQWQRVSAIPWRHVGWFIGTGTLLLGTYIVISPLPPLEHPQILAATQIAETDVPSLFAKGILPQYTETILGVPQEPVHILIVAEEKCLPPSLAQAGWLEADDLSLDALTRAAKAAFFNRAYQTAPMTPSFYATRPHDAGFEKETDSQSIRARHHARFWKTDYVTNTGRLYVGTVSLDTGLKWGITHAIAPDIDTERDLLVSDLKQANLVTAEQSFLLVPPQLGKNFTGDEFFTNGKAIILTLRPC